MKHRWRIRQYSRQYLRNRKKERYVLEMQDTRYKRVGIRLLRRISTHTHTHVHIHVGALTITRSGLRNVCLCVRTDRIYELACASGPTAKPANSMPRVLPSRQLLSCAIFRRGFCRETYQLAYIRRIINPGLLPFFFHSNGALRIPDTSTSCYLTLWHQTRGDTWE